MKRQIVEILDVKFDAITLSQAEERVLEFLHSSQKSIITTPNTEFVMRAQTDADFREVLNSKSRLNLPDSYGILWAAKFLSINFPKNQYLRVILVPLVWFFSLLFLPILSPFYKKPIPERISGADFIWTISKIAAKNNSKIFLLGGSPTVAERAALKLQTDIFDLRVAGVYSGDKSNVHEAIEAINRSRADILLVCFGAPYQENWLAENLRKTDCKIGIGLGGTFDFVANNVPRAPLWMRRIGLEWLFRLIAEPKRIKRQFVLPQFAWLILKKKINS